MTLFEVDAFEGEVSEIEEYSSLICFSIFSVSTSSISFDNLSRRRLLLAAADCC